MHIWVVETKAGRKWEPCAEAKLTRRDAKREAEYYWKHNNPADQFRVKKYVPHDQVANAQGQRAAEPSAAPQSWTPTEQ